MTWTPRSSPRFREMFLILGAIGCAPAAAQAPVEATGPYLHRAAGAVFPLQVGEFRRAQIHRYDEEGRDISASYNLVTPEGRLLITVYIYPATAVGRGKRGGLCDREFETATAAIRKQHSAGVLQEEGHAFDVPGTQKAWRHHAVFRMDMRFDGQVQPVRSEAHLYCFVRDNWFVKYRVSAPSAVTAPGAVEAFVRAGPWPDRGSADTVARR